MGSTCTLVWELYEKADVALSDEMARILLAGLMSDYEIYLSDYKDYDLSGVPVGIGCVEWMDYATMETFIDRMLSVMPQVLADQDLKMVFCMATRYAPDPESSDKAVPTGTYILYYGVCYSDTRLGRKVDVVPTLTDILGRSTVMVAP